MIIWTRDDSMCVRGKQKTDHQLLDGAYQLAIQKKSNAEKSPLSNCPTST